MCSRTKGRAATVVGTRRRPDAVNPFRSVQDVFDELREHFEDPDKDENMRREFKYLTQGKRRVADFFAECQEYTSYLGIQDKELIREAVDRLNVRLATSYNNRDELMTNFIKFKKWLIQVDNNHYAIKRNKETQQKEGSKKPSKVSFAPVQATPMAKFSRSKPRSRDTQDHQHDTDEKDGACYICHQTGHLAEHCPDRNPQMLLCSSEIVTPRSTRSMVILMMTMRTIMMIPIRTLPVEKLIPPAEDTVGDEVLALCNFEPVNATQLFTSSPLVVEGKLAVQDQTYPLRFLVDTGATGYAFIDRSLVPSICERLDIEPMSMSKPKRVRGFDGQLSPRPLTHCIHPNIVLKGHKELTAPMFITDLGPHAAILGKPWMNRFRIWLDMGTDSLWFPDNRSTTPVDGRSAPSLSKLAIIPPLQIPPPVPPKVTKILPRPKPVANDETFSMCVISAAAYSALAKRAHKDDTYLFACSIEEIDKEIALDEELKLEALELSSVEAATIHLEEVKSKLPAEYYNYLDVFDRAEANKLPPHRPSDHKIELTSNAVPPQSRAYKMSPFKLAKVREYQTENLSKRLYNS